MTCVARWRSAIVACGTWCRADGSEVVLILEEGHVAGDAGQEA